MLDSSNTSDLPRQREPRTNRIVHWPQSRIRRCLFCGLYFLFLAALIWGGNRLFWKAKFGVPLTSSPQVWDYYFPELRTSGVLDAEIKPDDGILDVVLLGASTLETGWGNIEELLLARLKQEFGIPVRIFNLAMVAHTSRDSFLKFSRIAEKPFDLIIVYDGFNDCRMNCCPPELFRDDYTHCSRYASFERRKEAGTIMLPPEILGDGSNMIGPGEPSPDMAAYGADLKTPAPFRQNLSSILEAAREQHALVVLNTFASHIPDDYTDEKLKAGTLDFGLQPTRDRCPLHMWGRKADVVACVREHNAVIRQLATKHSNSVLLVEQDELLSADGQNFVDVCHFTDQGCQRFVENVITKLKPKLHVR